MVVVLPDPTLQDLAELVRTDFAGIAFIFSLYAAGDLAGAINAGFLIRYVFMN